MTKGWPEDTSDGPERGDNPWRIDGPADLELEQDAVQAMQAEVTKHVGWTLKFDANTVWLVLQHVERLTADLEALEERLAVNIKAARAVPSQPLSCAANQHDWVPVDHFSTEYVCRVCQASTVGERAEVGDDDPY
jgi:hypothetical protein